MEFVRKKKRGQNKKVQKSWFSDEGYRIVWRKEVWGARVPARFQATVRTIIPNYGGVVDESFPTWDFTDQQHRLFKTMRKAQESCECHKRLWTKACEATGIRGLLEIFGKLPLGFPVWVQKKLNPKIYAVLTQPRTKHREEEECLNMSPAGSAPNLADPTRTSNSSVTPTGPLLETLTPASPAEGEERSSTRTTRRARSMAAGIDESSVALPAEAAAKGRKKPAARRTKRSSKRIAKRKPTSTDSSASGGKRSKGSRKKKSKQSAS